MLVCIDILCLDKIGMIIDGLMIVKFVIEFEIVLGLILK